MRQPLSFVSQMLVAAVVLGLGAAIWVAREPVSRLASGLFSSAESKSTGSKGRPRDRSGDKPVPVVVENVGEARNDLSFAGIGTARAVRHVTLYPAVSGEVRSVLTRAGDRVSPGARIIELDTRQAQLAVDMAASKLKGAERLLGRADRLLRRNVQSAAKVQDAETIADQAKVELQAAKVALTDHTITAPFAGIVGIANVGIGDRVTTATALVTLDDRSKLTVEFDVPETYLPRLRRGMKVDVRTPGFSDQTFVGVLSGIDSRVHPTRRTVAVRAEVANEEDLLRPGMSFAVDLKLPGEMYPVIPDLALQFSQKGNYVWRIDNDQADRVPVKIVRRDSNSVLVDGPIKPGDNIVIEGVQRLRPGRKVAMAPNARSGPDANGAGKGAKVN
jgi:RND family efflux transporter MFP subunit